MKEFLNLIISHIVSHPKDVSIDANDADGSLHFTITAHKDDLGKIIGKNGKTISAIRNLLKVNAGQNQQWVTIDVAEA